MELQNTPLQGCFILKPSVFNDGRGLFFESYHKNLFKKITGLEIEFVQDNQSNSNYGTLRGLHYQSGSMAQAKLVRVVQGKVLDIVVDIRKDSPSFGQHFSIILDDIDKLQLFVPRGFAHGFITLSKNSIFSYKCDNFYDKASDSGIVYNDATLSINWHLPEEDFIISDKDKELPSFKEVFE